MGYILNSSNIPIELSQHPTKTEWKDIKPKKTRLISMQYLFITDKVIGGEVNIEYMLTSKMIVDYFTKPLGRSLFWKLPNQIQGIKTKDNPLYKEARKHIMTNISKTKKQSIKWKNLQINNSYILSAGTGSMQECVWVSLNHNFFDSHFWHTTRI